MSKKQFSILTISCAGMGLLILDSRTALMGAADGISLTISVLIPSLFPFLFLTILLTGSIKGISFRCLRPLGKLFHIPAGMETVLAFSFLGGYPAGAQAISDTFHADQLSRKNSERMLAFCNNAGPSFLFGMAATFFSEKWMIWALWLFHILGALTAAQFFPCVPEIAKAENSSTITMTAALKKAITVMSVICGWVVICRVLISFLDKWLLWLFPSELRVLLIGLLELSNGICELTTINDIRHRFLICEALISLGGLCVGFQTQSVIESLRIRYYIGGKLIQTAVSLCFSAALFSHRAMLIPMVLLIIIGILKKSMDFRNQLVYNSGNKQGGTPYAVS